MRVGALIAADNADWSPDYLARVRSPDQGYTSVPFAEDIELSMRVAASQKGTDCKAREQTARHEEIAE